MVFIYQDLWISKSLRCEQFYETFQSLEKGNYLKDYYMLLKEMLDEVSHKNMHRNDHINSRNWMSCCRRKGWRCKAEVECEKLCIYCIFLLKYIYLNSHFLFFKCSLQWKFFYFSCLFLISYMQCTIFHKY